MNFINQFIYLKMFNINKKEKVEGDFRVYKIKLNKRNKNSNNFQNKKMFNKYKTRKHQIKLIL